MSEGDQQSATEEGQSLLHRLGHFGSTIGKKAPKKRSTRLIIQGGFAFLIFAFLVFTVASQWSELREKGVEFTLLWIIPAMAAMAVYYVLSAEVWGLILKFMGSPVKAGEAQRIWAQPLLVRYIPGSVLFVLARILLAEKVGVPRRVSTVGIVYEQAVSIVAAMTVATYFIITHPDLQDNPLRWLPLLVIPTIVVMLHPAIFGRITSKALTMLGREPLPQLMPFGRVMVCFVAYIGLWGVMGLGVYCAGRSVHFLAWDQLPTVAASQVIGFLAAVISAVTPAGLGVRDTAFAWAVKTALPSGSFGVGAVIAIAVRAVQTVVELIYVGAVTLISRRRGIP